LISARARISPGWRAASRALSAAGRAGSASALAILAGTWAKATPLTLNARPKGQNRNHVLASHQRASLVVASVVAGQAASANDVIVKFQPAFVETGSSHDEAGPA
jgi:hypothetical protein